MSCTDRAVSVDQGGRSRRVLVIDDNADSVETLQMLLEETGYDVEVAFAGDTGLQRAIEWLPDAIICDLGLPVLSGFEVAQQIRAHPSMADIFLIAVSGYGQQHDIQRARKDKLASSAPTQSGSGPVS